MIGRSPARLLDLVARLLQFFKSKNMLQEKSERAGNVGFDAAVGLKTLSGPKRRWTSATAAADSSDPSNGP